MAEYLGTVKKVLKAAIAGKGADFRRSGQWRVIKRRQLAPPRPSHRDRPFNVPDGDRSNRSLTAPPTRSRGYVTVVDRAPPLPPARSRSSPDRYGEGSKSAAASRSPGASIPISVPGHRGQSQDVEGVTRDDVGSQLYYAGVPMDVSDAEVGGEEAWGEERVSAGTETGAERLRGQRPQPGDYIEVRRRVKQISASPDAANCILTARAHLHLQAVRGRGRRLHRSGK